MIPKFPIFTRLELSHKSKVRSFTSKFEPYSDFNFTSLFCWDTDNTTELSMLNGNLVIKFADYTDGKMIYSFIGKRKVDKTMQELLKLNSAIALVPESVVKRIKNPNKFKVVEDRDAFDYIYDLSDLSYLKGGNHKKKRNKLSRLNLDIGSDLTMKVGLSLKNFNKLDLHKVLLNWNLNNNESGINTDREKSAIEKLIKHSNDLDLIVLSFYQNENVVGFSINEKINNKYAICHFEKALTESHRNIYTYVASTAAKELLAQGVKYVNWEQDLGLIGLRKAKQSYGPVKFLKKYQVSVNSGTL